jgi:DNA invertase Pin-like site-specific DNA recombinase
LTTLNVKNDVGVRARRKRGTKSIGAAGSVIVYLRVSTSEQALSGLGLEAQRATVAAYAERKGLTIVHENCDEGISAKSLNGRPGALAAIKDVRNGRAEGLLFAKLDRLSRSVLDGAGLMEQAAREGWVLHFADLDIDTSTPAGEMAANIIIAGSQYERRLISQRTRDALGAKRARGERLGGEKVENIAALAETTESEVRSYLKLARACRADASAAESYVLGAEAAVEARDAGGAGDVSAGA